jgi:hypothetical protein
MPFSPGFWRPRRLAKRTVFYALLGRRPTKRSFGGLAGVHCCGCFPTCLTSGKFGSYLSWTIEQRDIRKQDASYVLSSVGSTIVGSAIAWQFLKDNWCSLFVFGGFF